MHQILQTSGVFPQAVSGIASIDLKKDEAGLRAFAEKWNLPLTFYTSEELLRAPGTFRSSDFVRRVTGVDCVCERSAVRLAMDSTGSEGGRAPCILVEKQSLDGVTAALALLTESRKPENRK